MTIESRDPDAGIDPNVHEALGRFFGAHNARAMPTDELVASFVPSEPWWELVKPRNHLLIGPRGAGKTHLLKMLQPAALGRWKAPELRDETPMDEFARSNVTYPAALVLSDRHWHAQLIAMTRGLPEQWSTTIQSSALTIAVMKALLECVRQRSNGGHLPIELLPETASTLWRRVSSVWGMPPANSVDMLADHVSREANGLFRAATMLKTSGESADFEDLAVFGLDAHRAADDFVERVNLAVGQSDRRWALLFDELELASRHLQLYVEQLLRGGSPLLLIKVSLAPYADARTVINTPLGGMEGHDFHAISLTYPDKDAPRAFTTRLMERRLGSHGVEGTVAEILGEGDMDEEEGAEYAGLPTYRLLAERDDTFSAWLKGKGIDLDNLDALRPEDRAAWLRKPRGAITIREAYGFKRGGTRRSRRVPEPFSGAMAVCAVLEGNARWILGLTERLADAARGRPGRVPTAEQAAIVLRAAESYHNFLTMLPDPHSPEASARLHPVAVADRIGDFFHAHTVTQPFRPEPPTTFRVPADVSPDLEISLQLLLHAGALVHLPDSENQVPIGPLKGLRFRLAYLLAPLRPFPLRVSKTVSLNTILAGLAVDQMHLVAEAQGEEPEEPHPA